MIEPLEQAEWDALPHGRRFVRSSLTRAFLALTPSTGFKISCWWTHYKDRNQCNGSSRISTLKKVHHLAWRVTTICRDGTFYVWRYE